MDFMGDVLLLIDVQKNMLLPPEPVPAADRVGGVIERVLRQARNAGSTVVHVRNNGQAGDPDVPGSEGWDLVHEVLPGEHVVDKHSPDAFRGTDLESLVPAGARLVMVGMQSDFCVHDTALAARARGYEVVLVSDAHATYGATPEDAAAASAGIDHELRDAGVQIVRSDHLGLH
jgi:nicotinamidase-related amidase